MLTLRAGSLTHVGLTRPINEDYAWTQVGSSPEQVVRGLFIVCDGMGGHLGGEFASYWAVETVKQEFADFFALKDPRATIALSSEDIEAVRAGRYIPPRLVNLEERVQRAIFRANQVVFEYARHKPETAGNAGTTITMAAVEGYNAILANAGDSRTYLYREHRLQQMTRDHSLVADLANRHQITPEEIYTHPRRNVIYKFLGQKGLTNLDINKINLRKGDMLLLCSDGLWEMLRSQDEIVEILEASADPDAVSKLLVDAAINAGGEDNISVAVVMVS